MEQRHFGHITKLNILQRGDKKALREVANPFVNPDDLYVPYRSKRKTYRDVLPKIVPIDVLNYQKDIDDRINYQYGRYVDLLRGKKPMTVEWKRYGEKHVDEIYAFSKRSGF